MLGLWLIVAPFLLGAPTADLWNDVIVGGLIAVLAGYNWYRTTQGEEVSTSGAALNSLLGLWLIAAPFVFGVSGALLWNDVIVGIIVASLAGYDIYVGNKRTRSATGGTA